ncbi:hypothetical protein KSF_106590 [Reticulibacter mediterranei]|uniref:Uncharacterized protein n=1 Tax=Reticulibacter mediterranei TaxID=2778369 RepID=A0A8J3J4L6_9CHLR|nr:hypothetical protein [Reticulibacter mediterranei]GHP00612.1 hypothetical protein KSF_106590 [Reticulibacter mediterranei]
MEYIGLVNDKETLADYLDDGRRVYVQALSIFDATPKEERQKPEYWAARCDTGEFANPEANPLVWIEQENGECQYYSSMISREQATATYYAAQAALPKEKTGKIHASEMKQLVRAFAVKYYAMMEGAPEKTVNRLCDRFNKIFDRIIAKYPDLDLENTSAFLIELNNRAKAWWKSRPFKGPAVDW